MVDLDGATYGDDEQKEVVVSDHVQCGWNEKACGKMCCTGATVCMQDDGWDAHCCTPGSAVCGWGCCVGGTYCVDPRIARCCVPGQVSCGGGCCAYGSCTKSQVCCPAGYFAGDDDACHELSCHAILTFSPTVCAPEDADAGPATVKTVGRVTLFRRGHHACVEFPSGCQKATYNQDGSVTWKASPVIAYGHVSVQYGSKWTATAEMCKYGEGKTRLRVCETELCELDPELCTPHAFIANELEHPEGRAQKVDTGEVDTAEALRQGGALDTLPASPLMPVVAFVLLVAPLAMLWSRRKRASPLI